MVIGYRFSAALGTQELPEGGSKPITKNR